jgi:zeaxanthin glucosyltransferase
MARFLWIMASQPGIVQPMVRVLQNLVRRGHKVGWVCAAMLGPEVEALARRLPLNVSAVLDRGVAQATTRQRVAQGEDVELMRRGYLERVAMDEALVEPASRAIAAFRPDVVVIDGQKDYATIAAHRSGRPYAVVSHTLLLSEETGNMPCILHEAVASARAGREELFRRHGVELPIIGTCAVSPFLNVMFATAGLLGPVHVPDRTILAGPSVDLDRDRDPTLSAKLDIDPRPLVYVSLGTQYSWQPVLLERIAGALAQLDVAVCVAAGDVELEIVTAALPRAVVAVRMDQLTALERAALFVSHCGANSVMESVYFGVPIVGIPLAVDQPIIARLVKNAGIGTFLERDYATVGAIGAAIAAVVPRNSPIRVASRKLREEYRAADGGANTAAALSALA